jgi:hypothetical protein
MLQLFCWNTQAQSWQWGKRGGTTDDLQNTSEYVRKIVTDANGNIYLLVPVGISNLNIDGHPKATYSILGGGSGANIDFVIASFACDGSYRWSKVIGGQDSDYMQNLQIDAQGNLYGIGYIINNYDDIFEPGLHPQVHFDADLILPYASDNQNQQTMFMVKYDSNGVMQWVRFPQAANISGADSFNATPINLEVDPQGNSFWLCFLKPGTYCNGALVTTTDGYYLLKYDALGNFIGFSLMDIQLTAGSLYLNFKMIRNHNTGVIYISDTINKQGASVDMLTVGGQSIDHSKFVAAFNSNGALLWKIENNSILGSGSYTKVALDPEGNLYVNGGAERISFENPEIIESFNGVQFSPTLSSTEYPVAFVSKIDPNGNTIWQTNGRTKFNLPGNIAINGNEVVLVGSMKGAQQWGNISTPDNGNFYDVYLAKFNKTTGEILGINTIPSPPNTDDFGTAITTDIHDNYYIGGSFASTLTVGSSVIQSGGGGDFFIAKFGTSNCALGVETPVFKDLNVYPNPVQSQLYIDNEETMHYELYNVLGKKIQSGSLAVHGQVDCSSLSSGMYLLKLQNEKGEIKVVKVSRL